MATLYVRSTDGSDADNGSTWALAKATVAGAAAIDAAGDNVHLSDVHAESTASSITWSFAGTPTSPVKVRSTDDAAEPPTALTTTASVTTTGNNGITVGGSVAFFGVRFEIGTGASGTTASMTLTSATGQVQTYEQCAFRLNTTSSVPTLNAPSISGGQAGSSVVLRDCLIKFGHSSQDITIGRGLLEIDGLTLESGGTSPTTLINLAGSTNYGSLAQLSRVDLTNASASIDLVGGTGYALLRIRNVTFPASWSGSIFTGTVPTGVRIELFDSVVSGGAAIKMRVVDAFGSIREESTIVRTGGASESWCFATTSVADGLAGGLRSPEIILPLPDTGSPVTIKLHLITDGATLTDADINMAVRYLGTAGSVQRSTESTALGFSLASPTNLGSSAETWTTTGMSSPTEQELSVTVTPESAGDAILEVTITKASATVYVCPLAEVS